jgi:hypothetical protein
MIIIMQMMKNYVAILIHDWNFKRLIALLKLNFDIIINKYMR